MRYSEPDIYLTATLVNGLPTCAFAPKPYHRKIVCIVVQNSVPCTVKCFRGQLGSVPVSTSNIGNANTMRGTISLPAGQAFFVQWSAVGTNVNDATARVSFERVDNPLEDEGSDGHSWEVQEQTFIRIPNTALPNQPQIFIGQDVPEAVQFAVQQRGKSTRTAIGVLIYALNLNPDGNLGSAGDYWFEALTVDTTTFQLAKVTGVVSDQRLFYTWLSEYLIPYNTGGPLGTTAPYFGSGLKTLFFGDISDSPMVTDTQSVLDGISMPRGVRGYAASGSNTGAVGAGFTLVLTTSSISFRPSRTYRIELSGFAINSLATNVIEFAVNIDYGSGDIALWYPGGFGPSGAASGIATYAHTHVSNTTSSTKTGVLKVYIRASGGGTVDWRGINPLSGLANPREISVYDVGNIAQFPNALTLP